MARLSDAEWMRRFVDRLGSQKAVAERLGVSASLVGRIVRGQRSGERYRDAARAGAQGRRVTAPAPTARTPRRVRKPVRQATQAGGSRVMTRSPRLVAREVERTLGAGRQVSGFTVTLSADRAQGYRHKSAAWSGSLTIADPTDEQLTALMAGDHDGILSALRANNSWLGNGQIFSMTFFD